jgi:hypothetical protein
MNIKVTITKASLHFYALIGYLKTVYISGGSMILFHVSPELLLALFVFSSRKSGRSANRRRCPQNSPAAAGPETSFHSPFNSF